MNVPEELSRKRGERLNALTHTGPDTLMGQLLRRFWQPVAVSKHLNAGSAKPIRIMCENLTLYRSDDGNAHLVGAYCAHRRSLLHTGWVEGEEIRCIYHGWKFDGTGQCTLRPAERDTAMPNITIPGYPVHEYGGMIFAYLGPDEPPAFELPRKPSFEGNGFHVVRRQVWPCNWLQLVENSLDALHVSFVHARGRAGRFIENVSQILPELDYVETEAGIRQIATRGPDNVRISDWTFPNNNHIKLPGPLKDGPWIDAGIWNVPIDDTQTMRLNIYAMPSLGKEIDDKLMAEWEAHENYDPSHHHDELLYHNAYPEDHHSDLTNAQDYVAQVGQGTVADRENEILGRSDAGIAFLRRLFFRELDLIRENKPTKAWHLLDHPVDLPTQHAGSVAG
jgi:5,5'-dehydrodivanillate O-demethylase